MVWEPKRGCCCCATPRTATIILGWKELILTVIYILGLIVTAVQKGGVKQKCIDIFGSGSADNPDSNDLTVWCENAVSSVLFTAVGEVLLQVTISILLLVGVYKHKHCLMLPYMIIQCLWIGLFIFTGVAGIFSFFLGIHWIECLIGIVVGGIGAFICTYFFLVVRVCYIEVKVQETASENEDLEVRYITNREATSADSKNVSDPSSGYTRLDNQERYPPSHSQSENKQSLYPKLENESSAPPPY